jgi:formiminotetrahydrofolate cyclodeaminase
LKQPLLNHSPESSLADLPVDELLRQLGSAAPTPGGGAAAALAGSLGAALIQMTANLTIGRPRFAQVQAEALRIEVAASDLRARLARLADDDADAFERVSSAYKLPRATDDERAARAEAIQMALRTAADVPLRTAQLCSQVLELAEQAAPVLNPAVISDVLVGSLLARGGLESAAINVEVNLAAMTDAHSAERLAQDLEQTRSGLAERVERIFKLGRERLPPPVRKQ